MMDWTFILAATGCVLGLMALVGVILIYQLLSRDLHVADELMFAEINSQIGELSSILFKTLGDHEEKLDLNAKQIKLNGDNWIFLANTNKKIHQLIMDQLDNLHERLKVAQGKAQQEPDLWKKKDLN